jgi:UPF0716 protein FxsA
VPAILLILAFIVVPLVELAVIIQVGQEIGLLPTVAILLADSILGGLLMRSQGRAAWRRFNDAMRAGRVPHREALDGALVIFGGALLLTPGFITDIVGLLLLLPPTRAVARRIVSRLVVHRVLVGAAGAANGAVRARRRRPVGTPGPRAPRRPYDVEGTATETDSAGEAESRRLER